MKKTILKGKYSKRGKQNRERRVKNLGKAIYDYDAFEEYLKSDVIKDYLNKVFSGINNIINQY